MSAANFSMMRDFPLYAKSYTCLGKRCPECGALMADDDDTCELCGCDHLDEAEYYYDEIAVEDDFHGIEEDLEDINDDLMFHKIKVQSGYYSGLQFYVDVEHDLAAEDYDNDDCHYYFDCCRSVAYRKYASEVKRVNRILAKVASSYGFQEYVCTARFSNGEAWYEPADDPRARLKAAAIA